MSNEDELNPNITANDNLSNLYSENIDSTQNTTASLFPSSSLDENNGIPSEQNSELSNLFQNGSNDAQLNNDDKFIINNENNNISAASSLFNNSPDEQQQTNTNNQQYYDNVQNYNNQEPQYYQQPQDSTQNNLIQQQNSFNEQNQQVQETFNQQQQVQEAFIQQQSQEAFIQQQQQVQAALIQQQQQAQEALMQQQNIIQPPQPQNIYQQNTYYQQYQQPYYSTPDNQNNPYINPNQPPPPQQQQQQQQTTPYGVFISPQQVQQPQPIIQPPPPIVTPPHQPITQPPPQYNYSHHTSFQNSYPNAHQNQQEQVGLQAFGSAPVKMGLPPPPKGPSPTYFTPHNPGEAVNRQTQQNQQQQQQLYSPKRMFVPNSPTSQQQQQQKSATQIQQTQLASQNAAMQASQVRQPPQQPATKQQPQQQGSPRSPGGTKRGPVFVAPYIPGQTAPSRIITPVQPQTQTEGEAQKFRPPPPIAQPPNPAVVSQKPIQQPPPNTFVPPPQIHTQQPNTKQQQIPPPPSEERKFQPPPPPMATGQAAQKFQPPPPMAKPPPPVTKGPIYVPGQGTINTGDQAASVKAGDASSPVSSQPASSSLPSQPKFAPPPPIPGITAPKPAPYVPGQQAAPPKAPYVPGGLQQADSETAESKPPPFKQPPPAADIKKPPQLPSFFTPHEASNAPAAPSQAAPTTASQPSQQPAKPFTPSQPAFMKPPPMPVPLPVGVPVQRPPDDTSNKKRKKRCTKNEKKLLKREAFEPSPVPHFMTPEAVASRGPSLPHSQTTGDVTVDEKGGLNDYDYEYEYEDEQADSSGVKHSVSEPNSVVPISQFTGVFEPFFTKKKPVTALGFGGLFLSRSKEGENEGENEEDKQQKKPVSFVNINKINDKNFTSISPSSSKTKKEEFVSARLSDTKKDDQRLLWAATRIFLELGSLDFSEEEINDASILKRFRQNLRKEGTSESQLINVLSISDSEAKQEETIETQKTDQKSDEEKIKLLSDVQNKIEENGIDEALEFAIQNEIWPVALIISSSISNEASQRTVSKYIESELKKGSSGNNFSKLSDALSAISGIESENFDASKWKENLRQILVSLNPVSQKTTLVKLADDLESNKMSCASLACRILANLQMAPKIAFFSSHVPSTKKEKREAKRCFSDFCSFVQSIIEESPASLQVLQVATILASEKVENENLMLNLSILRAAAQSDYGLENKSKEDLEKLKNDIDGECFTFAKRFLENLNRLTEKVNEESIKVVPLRKEDLPPPPKPETESNNFFIPMATFIPGLSSNVQQQNSSSNQSTTPNQPSFFTPSSSTSQPNHTSFFTPNPVPSAVPQNRPPQPSFYTPNSSSTTQNHPSFFTPNSSSTQNPIQSRSSPINFYPKNDIYDNNEDNGNAMGGNIDTSSKPAETTKSENEPQPKPKSTDSQEKQSQQDNQPKRGWFSNLFSKLNPFSSTSKIVDLSEHDNGEMVWNGHRYVMKGHENDDDSKSLPPPPPKGMAPAIKSKSSPFPVSEPPKDTTQNSIPPPPSGTAGSPLPPPPTAGPVPPTSGSLTSPPIGAVAPVGRTRVSKRYVANF